MSRRVRTVPLRVAVGQVLVLLALCALAFAACGIKGQPCGLLNVDACGGRPKPAYTCDDNAGPLPDTYDCNIPATLPGLVPVVPGRTLGPDMLCGVLMACASVDAALANAKKWAGTDANLHCELVHAGPINSDDADVTAPPDWLLPGGCVVPANDNGCKTVGMPCSSSGDCCAPEVDNPDALLLCGQPMTVHSGLCCWAPTSPCLVHDDMCCGGNVCLADPGGDGEHGHCGCRNNGSSCDHDRDCCDPTASCTGEVCVPACLPSFSACGPVTADCCAGLVCANYFPTAAPDSTNCCIDRGGKCDGPNDTACCRGNCITGNVCTCLDKGAPCNLDRQCCMGLKCSGPVVNSTGYASCI